MQFITQNVEVCRCERSQYERFAPLHYLKGICKGASCYLFKVNGEIGAFASLLSMPFKGHANALIFHRIVILEQFQGLGLSTLIVNLIGGIYRAEGKDLYIKTDSTVMGKMLRSNPLWYPTAMNRRTRKLSAKDHKKNKARHRRAAYSFKYDGPLVKGYESISKSIDEVRNSVLIGNYVPVNVLGIAKITYSLGNPETIRNMMSLDFDRVVEMYGMTYDEVSKQTKRLYDTDYLIRRKQFNASQEYHKRLLFLNGLIRIIQHDYSIEGLMYALLKENHVQGFKLCSVDVIKVGLKVYNTDLSRYSNLVERIKGHASYKVNVEVARERGLNLKQASNIARKQLRAENISRLYIPEKTDDENLKHMARNGLTISLSTLKRWRKDNNISKYNKSVIPTA